MTDDTRERLIALEVKFEHMCRELSDTHAKVEEMHAAFMQAQGAKWAIAGLAGIAGFLAGLAPKFLPFMK